MDICTAGTFTAVTDTTTDDKWSCAGTGGGTTAQCSLAKAISTVSHTFPTITPGTPVIKTNFNLNARVKEIKVEARNSVQNANFEVTGYDTKPVSVLIKSGKVYRYFQITTDMSNANLEKATITIEVEKSWLSSNGLSRDSISTFKFDGTNWNELTTTYSSEDGTYYYYIFELTSFSYFAIGEEDVVVNNNNNNNGGGGGGGGSSCGNGIKTVSEQCDDDDRISGDGCSSSCRIESGYTCTGRNPSVCTRNLNVTANTFCLNGVCSSSPTTYTPSDTSDLAYTGDQSGFISGGPVEKSSWKERLPFYIYIFIAALLIGITVFTGAVLLKKWHFSRKIRHLEQEAVKEEHHLAGEIRGEIKREERRFGI